MRDSPERLGFFDGQLFGMAPAGALGPKMAYTAGNFSDSLPDSLVVVARRFMPGSSFKGPRPLRLKLLKSPFRRSLGVVGRFLRTPNDGGLFWLGYVALLGFFIAPLWVTRFLPGLDLPFHLSIVHFLQNADGPAYGAFYDSTFGFAPYAAHYGLMLALGKVFQLQTAHQVLMSLYVAAMPLALGALLQSFGRSRVLGLFGFFLAYNLTLHYGFLSFALSVPALLGFLALSVNTLRRERVGIWGWVAMLAAGVGLFLVHLQAYLYGICAFIVLAILVPRRWRDRGRGLAIAAALLGVFLSWQVNTQFAGDTKGHRLSLAATVTALRKARAWDLRGKPESFENYRDEIQERIELLPAHLLRGFNDKKDYTAGKWILGLLGGLFVFGTLGGIFKGARQMRGRHYLAGTVLVFGAALAYLGLPHHLPAFELTTFFPRFSVILVALMVLLVPPWLLGWQGPIRFLFLAAPLGLGVLVRACHIHGVPGL